MWGISWANLTILLATIPTYETEEEKKEKPIEVESFDEFVQFLNPT